MLESRGQGRRSRFHRRRRHPITAINEATVAASANADGGIILLGAIEAVEKIIVRGDVIKLRGWLIALRGPVFPPSTEIVAPPSFPLIMRFEWWGQPTTVMIAVGSVQTIPGLAAVHGAEESGVRDVDSIYIFRIGPDMVHRKPDEYVILTHLSLLALERSQ